MYNMHLTLHTNAILSHSSIFNEVGILYIMMVQYMYIEIQEIYTIIQL